MRKKFFLLLFVVGFYHAGSQNVVLDSKNSHFRNDFLLKQSSVSNPLLNQYDIKFYWLNLEIYRFSNFLKGNVLINSLVTANSLDTFAFELSDTFTIDSVIFEGKKLTFRRSFNNVFTSLGKTVYKNTMIGVRIYYRGNTTLVKNDFNTNMAVAFTDSEPFGASSFFPCKMDLEDKADSSWFFITTSSDCKAGSNGILNAVVDLGNGKSRYEWKSKYPIDYYLIATAVSKYREYRFSVKIPGLTDSVLIQNYVYDTSFYKNGNFYSYLDYNKWGLDQTANAMILYSELFGVYPFHAEKYGHCAVPLWGAMENQTMTFCGVFDAYIVAHELSHHWFGDNTTCSTWSDIWVNEGFADYCEYLYEDKFMAAHQADTIINGKHKNIMSEPGGSVYVPTTEAMIPGRIFSGRLSYNKGGCVLHMLRFEMDNDSLFFLTFRKYLQKYQYKNATGLDFKAVLEETTGKDYTTFFNQWYFGEGYPVYDIIYTQNADTVFIHSNQSSSVNADSFFRMKMQVRLYYGTKDSVITFYQNKKTELLKIPFHFAIDSISLDPYVKTFEKASITRTGINDKSRVNYILNIYPVPATDFLHLSFICNHQAACEFYITDLSGKKICENRKLNSEQIISLENINPGVYILVIKNGNDFYSKLFIRN